MKTLNQNISCEGENNHVNKSESIRPDNFAWLDYILITMLS